MADSAATDANETDVNPDPPEQLSLFGATDHSSESSNMVPVVAPSPAPARNTTVSWPDHERFPHNDHRTGRSVGYVVLADLTHSREPLIISGYSSLHQLVTFLADRHTVLNHLKSIRILLGHEPNLAPRKEYRKIAPRFDQDIEAYWTERGISLYQSADVFATMKVLEDQHAAVRISGNPKSRFMPKSSRAIRQSHSAPATSA